MANNLISHSPMAFKYYREQLSLSRELLAKKTKIPLYKIENAEHDEFKTIFTFNQIKKIASILLIPEFYLLTDKIQTFNVPTLIDHRNHSNIVDKESEYKLNKVIREVIKCRDDLIYTYDSMDVEPKSFNLELTGNNCEKDALLIRDFLGISEAKFLDENSDYYKSWRSLIESKDVLVIEISRRKIGSEGMALYYPKLPLITILSSGQSYSRKLFTMVHELVHLGLRQSALDGYLLHSNYDVEKYCNQVAGYVLVPETQLIDLYECESSLIQNVENIRRALKVSKQAIAIQLKITNRISQTELDEYLRYLDESNSGFGKNGKQYTAANKFGKVYLQQVISAVWDNSLPINTAMNILNLNSVDQLSYLEQKVFG